MSDTPGYEAEPADAEGLTDELTEFADDPLVLFARASALQAMYRAAANRAADYRARAIAQLHAGGLSYAQIADRTALTRPRVQKLVERGRALNEATPVAVGQGADN